MNFLKTGRKILLQTAAAQFIAFFNVYAAVNNRIDCGFQQVGCPAGNRTDKRDGRGFCPYRN